MIKAILFDLWGTLIHDTPERGRPRQVWRTEGVQNVLKRFQIEIESPVVLQALDDASRSLTNLHDTGRDLDSLGRVNLFLGILEDRTGIPVPKEAFEGLEAAIVTMPIPLAPEAAPHAVETLAHTKQLGLATALVSNVGMTTSPALRTILDAYGFTPHLDTLVFSDELGIAKPERAIFEEAWSKLGLEAADCAFVGDAPHNDVWGAESAGLYTVQIGDKAHDTVRPQARIAHLAELLPALASAGLLTLVPAK